MNASNLCPRCSKINPAGSSFCNQCGLRLSEPKSGEPPKPSTAPADIVTANRAGIEYEALNSVKQKALEWAKLQVGGIAVFLALGGWLGFSEWSSWKKQVEEFHRVAAQSLHQITNASYQSEIILAVSTQRMARVVTDLTNLVQESQGGIGRLTNSVTTNMYALLTTASNSLSVIESTREVIDRDLLNIQVELAATKRLKHSLMDLFVEFQGEDESVSLFKQKSLKNLADEGFVVKDQYIARLNLDKSEVVYFHSSAGPEAAAITNILNRQYTGIKSRLYNRPERGPREILIKLKDSN